MHGPSGKDLASFVTRTAQLTLGVAAFTFIVIGCSDYRGYLNHATSIGVLGPGNKDIWCAPGKNGQDSDNDNDSDNDSDSDSEAKKHKGKHCGEAKLWGSEVSVIVTNPDGTIDRDQSGTFSSTVAYDWRGFRPATLPPFPVINPMPTPAQTYPSPIDLTTYRNRVVGAFNADGQVDRDGDDIRWNSGDFSVNHDPADPAGIWERRWLYRDRHFGCQFAANFKKAYGDDRPNDPKGDPADEDDDVPDPLALVCNNAPGEEVDDQDESLQCGYRGGRSARSSDPNPATPACRGKKHDKDTDDDDDSDSDSDESQFSSLDDLFRQIWSGAISGSVTLELVELAASYSANGVGATNVGTLETAAEIEAGVGAFRVSGVLFDLAEGGGQELVKALLANTPDDQAVTLNLRFDGGLGVSVPRSISFKFNHAQLEQALSK